MAHMIYVLDDFRSWGVWAWGGLRGLGRLWFEVCSKVCRLGFAVTIFMGFGLDDHPLS